MLYLAGEFKVDSLLISVGINPLQKLDIYL